MGKGKIAAVAVAACMLLQSAGLFGCGGNMKENKQGVYALSDQEFTLSQLAGTDALGRRVEPTGGNIGGKYVAVYFFVWFGTHSQRIYDIGELLEEYERILLALPLGILLFKSNVSPTPKTRLVLFSETFFGAALTITLQVAVLPLYVLTVMVVVPIFLAVTIECGTVATDGLLEE